MTSVKKISKTKLVEENYLDLEGCSNLINRYKLPEGLYYTSGDGIFRNDSDLGKKYKFFRFSPSIDFEKKKSYCWKLTEEDKEMLLKIHETIHYTNKTGPRVEYIQFFGKCENIIYHEPPRNDIISNIRKRPCANCGTKTNIECDHKNDLKNDIRVMKKETQTIDDFQSLCKHCNDRKRAVKEEMLKTNKRIGAKTLGFKIDFTSGDETLNKDDPNWYIGTYWGDCIAFKQSI